MVSSNPTLIEVCTEIFGAGNHIGKSLRACFAGASGTFTTTERNSLRDFAGYTHLAPREDIHVGISNTALTFVHYGNSRVLTINGIPGFVMGHVSHKPSWLHIDNVQQVNSNQVKLTVRSDRNYNSHEITDHLRFKVNFPYGGDQFDRAHEFRVDLKIQRVPFTMTPNPLRIYEASGIGTPTIVTFHDNQGLPVILEDTLYDNQQVLVNWEVKPGHLELWWNTIDVNGDTGGLTLQDVDGTTCRVEWKHW